MADRNPLSIKSLRNFTKTIFYPMQMSPKPTGKKAQESQPVKEEEPKPLKHKEIVLKPQAKPKKPASPEPAEEEDPKIVKGRKPKYATEDARKEARRAQNKLYRERKRKELEDLRKTQAKAAPDEADDEADE
jgi:hypothetical protein